MKTISCDMYKPSFTKVVSNSFCEINQITVDGCDPNKTWCYIPRGTNATIKVEFVPHFCSRHVSMDMHVQLGSNKFNISKHIDNEACKFMTCPVESFIKNEYKYTDTISRNLPKGMYLALFVMREDINPKCCFGIKVGIN
ncbi:unnamed protein product [Chironomus riparius]|uniref:MD-2-related lipid-recognition domain-containing protein n=1 Tax=Chironomus riparius TaxID=315576 RepID=A0A9N9WPB2_9DIPT|nr:unnamed protein product [Chironomus riparius]